MNENEKGELDEIMLCEAKKILIDIFSTQEGVDTAKKIVSVASIFCVFYAMTRKK